MSEVKDKSKTFSYATKNDGFSMWLDGEHVHAKNKVLTLTQKQHDELQALIRKGRHDISSELTYLDTEAAEAVAREYLASRPAAAHAGAGNSNTGKHLSTDKILEGNQKIPAGITLQERLKANKENLLATKPVEDAPKPVNLDVIEEEVHHADNFAAK